MKILNRVVWAIGALTALWLLKLVLTDNGLPQAGFTALFLVLLAGLIFLIRKLPALPHWVYLLIAGLFCLIPRLVSLAVFPIDMSPVHDFSTYFRLAESFAQSGEFVESSCNLFPHILFYALYLSVPFRIFGSSVLTYQLCNLFLSMAAMALLYWLLNKLFGRKTAFLGALAFSVFPTLVFYAPLNCHEHLVLFLMIAFMALFFWFVENPPTSPERWALIGDALGILLLALDLIRPLGLVMILTCTCWLILKWRKGAKAWNTPALGIAVLLFLTVFIGGRELVYRAADSIRPEPLARSSLSFTLLAGSNREYSGTWNDKDSAFFLEAMRATYDDGFNYTEGSAKVMEVVKERYANMSWSDFVELANKKNTTIWGAQRTVFQYLTLYRDPAKPSLISHKDWTDNLGCCCDSAVSVCLIAVLILCILRVISSNPAPDAGLFGVIGFIGFVCMHTLTEAAGRYSVSAIPLLLLALCSLATPFLNSNSKDILRKESE